LSHPTVFSSYRFLELLFFDARSYCSHFSVFFLSGLHHSGPPPRPDFRSFSSFSGSEDNLPPSFFSDILFVAFTTPFSFFSGRRTDVYRSFSFFFLDDLGHRLPLAPLFVCISEWFSVLFQPKAGTLPLTPFFLP